MRFVCDEGVERQAPALLRLAGTTPEAKGRILAGVIAEHAAALLTVMDLAELRGAVHLTQEELAERLFIAQSNVSRLEHRREMLISTLQEVIRALGGELRLSAVFPDGVVEINQFLAKQS